MSLVTNRSSNEPLLARLGRLSGSFAERYVPDPWIYAITLTLFAMLAAVVVTDHSPCGPYPRSPSLA